jgi:hypothetical protein
MDIGFDFQVKKKAVSDLVRDGLIKHYIVCVRSGSLPTNRSLYFSRQSCLRVFQYIPD